MRYFLILLFILSLFSQEVSYSLSFPNAEHHEAEIELIATNLKTSEIRFLMSRSSPGRYALHEFSKNVYNVKFYNGKNEPLKFTRENLHEWKIAQHDGTIKVTYTLFGDHADGTYAGINTHHAHLNAPASFMYLKSNSDYQIKVNLTIPKQWKVATQLKKVVANKEYFSPNIYYLMDSPIEMSNHLVSSWDIDGQKISIALHHQGTQAELDRYMELAKRTIAELHAVFGEFPKFDYGEYVFLADYLPYVKGDGMEHRNSTVISSSSLTKNTMGVLGTLTHESFHSWNVERLRPKTLEPFNFQEANVSDVLWFAEGFTSYYDELAVTRADLRPLDDYLSRLSSALNYVLLSSGRDYYSIAEMSQQAPFVDAAKSIDEQNKSNTFISYYTGGEVIALALDLSLRSRFNKSLDGYMQLAWKRFGKTEKPYMLVDLQNLLEEYTSSKTFSDDFFDRFILGRDVPDYKTLLAFAGFDFGLLKENDPWIGNVYLKETTTGLTILNTVAKTSPLYAAGIGKKDVLKSIGDQTLTSKAQFANVISELTVGDRISVTFDRYGEEITRVVQVAANPKLAVLSYESQNKKLTKEKLKFRRSWLESKSKIKLRPLSKTCSKCERVYPFKTKKCEDDGDTLPIF
jgi:predicted metalloprotease with PDZ domain